MAKPSKRKQQTLEATLGRPKIKPAVITPRKSTPTKGSPSKDSIIAAPPPPVAASSSSPNAGFMTSSQVILSSARKTRSKPSLVYLKELDNPSSATEEGEDELPVKSKRQKSKGKEKVVVISDDDEGEDEPPTKGKKLRGSKPMAISSSSASESPSPKNSSTPKQQQQAQQDDQDDEDDDDLPIITPVSARFNRKRRLAVDRDDSDDQPLVSSPMKKRRLIRKGGSSSPAKQQQDDSEVEVVEPTPKLRSSQTPRKHLSAKEKAREMLRRRRAGEIIEEESEEEEGEEEVEQRKALYDTDSDNLALSEFEDEEDEEEVPQPSGSDDKKKSNRGKKDKKKKKKHLKELKGESDDEGTEAEGEDLDDFVVEDDSDEPLGAPDELMQMPLQFTHHARKKLIEHFRDVVEWLVQFKINPGFAEKTAELYRIGWQKLDDEVRALATSKFLSSAWKPDFYKALRARPQYTSIEVGSSGHDSVFGANCEACGRSGHPATWTISFHGTPYIKRFGMDFLDPIEQDSSDDSSSSSSQNSDRGGNVDEDGNTIPPEDKTFYVGVVCNGNAEIAHTLIHWKHALLDWVESQLMAEGYMRPAKLAEREKMKLKKKYKLVDKIVEEWVERGQVRALFADFKGQLERARNQQTSGRGYRRG
ncbi:hypothetical protein B0T21DRAFT_410305 [Apiosordaria backusii]|uniref:DUF4211 domain-containing protein n=1 Tax=Apiosordaria backusii TaxID=314023 RepID=A0AA40BMC5_9PEZI|nr:hypothetical protein B0T21DRAFT_410305 [Apiosordaria backusii]